MLFLELNPHFALDIFAILDDLLPMVSSSNSEKTLVQRAMLVFVFWLYLLVAISIMFDGGRESKVNVLLMLI